MKKGAFLCSHPEIRDKFSDFSSFMEVRIKECHRVMKSNANIVIHVEPRISHHIRNICDKISVKKTLKTRLHGFAVEMQRININLVEITILLLCMESLQSLNSIQCINHIALNT